MHNHQLQDGTQTTQDVTQSEMEIHSELTWNEKELCRTHHNHYTNMGLNNTKDKNNEEQSKMEIKTKTRKGTDVTSILAYRTHTDMVSIIMNIHNITAIK
jgi:hypothetical protein